MKSISNTSIIGGFAIVLTLSNALPAAADPRHGEQLARRWCADCHVVAPRQRRPTAEAAPFATIANRPNFNAENVAIFLLEPHPKMPSMSLTRAEAIDLAQYIASLRK